MSIFFFVVCHKYPGEIVISKLGRRMGCPREGFYLHFPAYSEMSHRQSRFYDIVTWNKWYPKTAALYIQDTMP